MKNNSPISSTLRWFAVWLACAFVVAMPVFYWLTKLFYAEDVEDVVEAMKAGESVPDIDLEQDIAIGMMMQFGMTFIVIAVVLVVAMRSQLIRRNIETFRRQKEFTENASHELQTPLAIARGKLDLLVQEPMGERAAAIVADLYDINIRMERLNRNLLLLTKIDNEMYKIAEMVDVRQFVERLLPSYRLLYDNVTVVGDGNPKVRANSSLMECLLNNLVANAIRSVETLLVRSEECGARSEECVADNGIKIWVGEKGMAVSNPSDGVPLDASTMFERFKSGDGSRGNGLGLSIVAAVCRYHRWGIHYAHANGRHVFTVTF